MLYITTHSGPEVLFQDCVAMKFVDDDDDDVFGTLVIIHAAVFLHVISVGKLLTLTCTTVTNY